MQQLMRRTNLVGFYIFMGLFIFIFSACGGGEIAELFDQCLTNKNNDYAQSEAIQCDHRLKTGTQGFQASDSTRDVQFSPDGNTLYTMSTLIQTWDVASGNELNVCTLEDCHTSFEFGNQMYFNPEIGYVGFNQVSRIYTGLTTKEAPLFKSDIPPYTNEAYIPGQDVFASYNKELIYFYDRTSSDLVSEQSIQQGIVQVVGGTRSYATSISDYRIVIWPIAEDMSGLVLDGHQSDVIKMIYSDDESLFLSADRSGTVIVWDLNDGTILHRFRLTSDEDSEVETVPTVAMALSPDNMLLATRADGRKIRFWSLATQTIIAEVGIAKFGVMDLDISPDGSKLAVGLSWAGIYNQNARTVVTSSQPFDPDLLEPGDALILDISELRP